MRALVDVGRSAHVCASSRASESADPLRDPHLALGADLLLAVNVVCINLSAKLMFQLKGVKPRTWLEKRKARQSVTIYILIWIATLGILLTAIMVRHRLSG